MDDKIKKALRVMIFSGLLLLLPSICAADAGLPMIVWVWPAMIVAMIPIIAIETIIFKHALNAPYVKTTWAVSVANVVSTMVGYPLSWFLLLGVQILTPGGSSGFGTATLWERIASVTAGAAWLAPHESELYWMVPVAAMVGLIPAFLISVYLEAFLVGLFFVCERGRTIIRISSNANLVTYLLLEGILVLCLVFRAFG